MRKYLTKIIFIVMIVAFVICCAFTTPISQASNSLWALLPPIIAIGLALITKEVYSSLFIGTVAGGVLYAISSATGIEGLFSIVIKDGIIANISDSSNVGILIFLVVLGTIVVLVNKAGGSIAYGKWATKRIKSKKGASLATIVFGILIFVDDYFNCLTVGSVMRPITDKYKVSRAKLAYLIDATAAPICIIAPISSWAAAVSGTVKGVNGIQLFISTIPYNLYAILTIIMVVFIALSGFDYGYMKLHEDNAQKGDLFTSKKRNYNDIQTPKNSDGKVMDLILPVVILVLFCIVSLIYTGGFFDGANFVDAFANCDSPYGLSLGSITALIVIIIYYMFRGVLTFTECMDSISDGFKQMVPAILILIFAWTLKTITNHLEIGTYVAGIVSSTTTVQFLLPIMLFVVSIGLSFSTGTSWGTFGILIPIVINIFEGDLANVSSTGDIPEMVIICISACLAGAVCGDHCSPISDTTIMASSGAQCNHMDHVSTQIAYCLTVAVVCAVGFIIAGFIQNVFVVLGISVILMFAVLFAIKFFVDKNGDDIMIDDETID